ncbi:MAG: glycogen synthase [Polyangiaceae bacterium]
MRRPPRVLMISSEVECLARTGGLGDVVDALSTTLGRRDASVIVVTPKYGTTRMPPTTRWPSVVPARHGWAPHDVRDVGVLEVTGDLARHRRLCLLDDPPLFDRGGIYGDAHGTFGDNDLRFAVLSRAALEVAGRAWDGGPDVIHAHDWHAAFAVLYARLTMGVAWSQVPVVFTLHNIAFQGVLGADAIDRLAIGREAFVPEVLEQMGRVNLVKGATALADRITTVSPTHAREICTPAFGFGLDGHLTAHAHRLTGILNGIDVERFDPRADGALARVYDERTLRVGKDRCKQALSEELGLTPGPGPLFGVVSRLTWQKGIDLLEPLVHDLVGRGARLAVVGQGDPTLERALLDLAARFPGRVATRIAFDPPLSRRVYAASDFFLVPSRFEPCGLTQMYAMRYGAIPIVADVGGLHDTVTPITDGGETGSGFVFSSGDVVGLGRALGDALELFDAPEARERVARRLMQRDFSWDEPARQYEALYAAIAPRIS